MNATRDVIAVYGQPRGETREDGIAYTVGQPIRQLVDGKWTTVGTVTRITVTDDLPGLHCNMERVRVFDGDTLIFEGPLHSLEGVEYAALNLTEEQTP